MTFDTDGIGDNRDRMRRLDTDGTLDLPMPAVADTVTRHLRMLALGP